MWSSRQVKLMLLGLLVLLAWPYLGPGGRAEAGFSRGVTSTSVTTPSAETTTTHWFGFEGLWWLTGEEAPPEPTSSRQGVGGESAPPAAPGDAPRRPYSPRTLFAVAGPSGGGMSSRGGASPPTGTPAGLCYFLPFADHLSGADASGLMLPEDERLHTPSTDSRLFRPPRAV